ncbi:hypothetical protein ACHAQA_007842 [Verticillium albo-atrum]
MSILLKALPFFALVAASDLNPELGGFTSSGSPASSPPFGLPVERFEDAYSKPNANATASYGNLGFGNGSDTWSIHLSFAANVSMEGATQADKGIGKDSVTQLTVLSLERSASNRNVSDSVRVSVFDGLSRNATDNEDNIDDCDFLSDACRSAILNTANPDDSGLELESACREWLAGSRTTSSFDLGLDNLNNAEPFNAHATRPTEKSKEETNEMYEYALTKVWAIVLRATEAGSTNESSSAVSALRCLRAGTIEDESGQSDGSDDNDDSEGGSGENDDDDDGNAAGMIRASASAAVVAFVAAMIMA